MIINFNVWLSDGTVRELEANMEDITFKNGMLYISEKSYLVKILRDEENIPKGFLTDGGDGCPRVISDWRGFENYWMIDDVMLVQ